MAHKATGRLPAWIKDQNREVIAQQQRGVSFGPIHVLSVPGRKTGEPRTTPVSVLPVDGERYIVGSTDADWVKNAQAAGRGLLAYGSHEERVSLEALPLEQRAEVLREFPTKLPGGVPFFRSMYEELPEDDQGLPEAFAGLAPQCVVFRVYGETAPST